MTTNELLASLLSQVEKITGVRQGPPYWSEIARPEQLRPEGCDVFALTGGRGSGKTRAGAEDTLERMRSGEVSRIHVIAPTFADARDVCIEGDSGILACARPGEVSQWNRSMGELRFVNGTQLKIFSGEEPDRLNGPQAGAIWIDEFYSVPIAAIDQALFGLRIGTRTTACYTSTPKPTASTKYVLNLPGIHVSRMRTRDNAANLAPGTVEALEAKYGGTRLGRVELEGEIIEEVEGSLWNRSWFEFDGFRLPTAIRRTGNNVSFTPPDGIVKIVVALDPSVSDPEKRKNPHKEPDACGIVVAGLTEDARFIVLGDYTAVLSPSDWARAAIGLYSLCRANAIVAEANQGGELIREVLRQYGNPPIELVHASMAKRPRAEPLAMLYEQGRAHHCGPMDALEDQMASWDASDPSQKSPNNVDAAVWAAHGLGLCVSTGMRRTERLKVNR